MTRDQWFAMLAALAYPADPSKAGLAFKPFMPWFDDMPQTAFTRESLEAVVTSPRKMAIPSYDEIRRPLAAWWRDNRAPAVRLESDYPKLSAPEPRRAPTDLEKHIAGETVRNLKAEIAEKRRMSIPDEKLRPTPLPLPDEALLIEYERTVNDTRNPVAFRNLAAIRVRMLREKLGMEEMQHAAD